MGAATSGTQTVALECTDFNIARFVPPVEVLLYFIVVVFVATMVLVLAVSLPERSVTVTGDELEVLVECRLLFLRVLLRLFKNKSLSLNIFLVMFYQRHATEFWARTLENQ